jgi:hypothetical protein
MSGGLDSGGRSAHHCISRKLEGVVPQGWIFPIGIWPIKIETSSFGLRIGSHDEYEKLIFRK